MGRPICLSETLKGKGKKVNEYLPKNLPPMNTYRTLGMETYDKINCEVCLHF